MNYIVHFYILASAVVGCVSISSFSFLFSIPTGIASSAAGFKIYAITAGIKNYQSIIKKKKKNHDKIVFLAKTKLNSIEALISRALIDSYISHDESFSVSNVLRE